MNDEITAQIERTEELLQFAGKLIDPFFEITQGMGDIVPQPQKRDLSLRISRIKTRLNYLKSSWIIETKRRNFIESGVKQQIAALTAEAVSLSSSGPILTTDSTGKEDITIQKPSDWSQMSKNQRRRWKRRHNYVQS